MGHEARARASRRVLPGYPKEEMFTDPKEVAEYFCGSKIVCLRCGKKYRTLGVHLQRIHGMEPDEYREIYGLPWTHGLSCADTTALHAEHAAEMIEKGVFDPNAEQAALARSHLPNRKKYQPYRQMIGRTEEAAERKKQIAKRGTPEFKEKMRNRPQTIAAKEFLKTYWIGREQSDEHVFKRTGRHRRR